MSERPEPYKTIMTDGKPQQIATGPTGAEGKHAGLPVAGYLPQRAVAKWRS